MGKIGIIIGREYLSRVSKKSFIIMTVLGPLIIGGIITLMIWLSMEEEKESKVWVVDPSGLLMEKFEDKGKIRFFYDKLKIDQSFKSEEDWKKEFKDSDYDLLFIVRDVKLKRGDLFYKEMPNFKTEKLISQQFQKAIEEYNIAEFKNFDRAKYEEIRYPVSVGEFDINAESAVKRERAYVGYFFTFLIYLFIFLYGVQVMRGVIEEKTSRIVEVMVSSVKPFQLMMGKIIGIAMVGLTQFLIWAVLTFSILYVSKATLFDDKYEPSQQHKEATADVTQTAGNEQAEQLNQVFNLIYYGINYTFMIGLFLFYFLFGYLMYAALFAAVGSAVDSEADTQQFMLPLTLPLVFGWMMLPSVISDPNSSTSFWMSIFPLTSPVVMMVRGSMGFEPGTVWQLFLSMALLIGAFIGTTWLAGKIYRTGILMYGKKATYKELWKWLRY
jgi:ABC-2 type transport system permease protein